MVDANYTAHLLIRHESCNFLVTAVGLLQFVLEAT